MSKRKKPKIAKVRPEEQAYLTRWAVAKSAPTLWEKIENDPVYEKAVKIRSEINPGSLGGSWGRSRGPK
jgi:hypothetical protein